MANKMALEVGERTLEMSRPFDVPREVLFRAFSDGEALKEWFGPEGWPLTTSNLDFRPGGRWHYCMTGPDGTEAWGIASYDEVVPPERIVYRDAFSDADGSIVPPESKVTISFEEQGESRSLMRWTSEFASTEERDQVIAMGVEEGTASTLDNLEKYLARVNS